MEAQSLDGAQSQGLGTQALLNHGEEQLDLREKAPG